MGTNKTIRNFLFLLTGIVFLFCASIPNLLEGAVALLRAALSAFGFGWVAALLIISKILLVLGGIALATLGIVFGLQDAKAAGKQPNWVVIGCTGGAALFALIGLLPVPFLPWICGILSIPALVVAMIFAYKDMLNSWTNPLSKVASFMMIGMLVAFYDRIFNIPLGLMESHFLAGLVGIAAFIYICVWKNKFAEKLDAVGQGAFGLIMIGSILYAVSTFLCFFPVLNWVGWPVGIAAWVLYLIAYIRLLNCTSFGSAGKTAFLSMLIGHAAAVLTFLPVLNLAALVALAFGWFTLINALEEKKA